MNDPGKDSLRIQPYLADITAAAIAQGVRPSVLAGVCSRETWFGWAPGYTPRGTHLGFGDNGEGFGLFQADRKTKAREIIGGDLDLPRGQADLAAKELAGNYRLLGLLFPQMPHAMLEQAMCSAYNAWLGKVAGQIAAGRNPDEVTTPGPSGRGDYGSDVLQRADRLLRDIPALGG